ANNGIVLVNAGSNVTISGNTMRNNAHSGIHINNSSPAISVNTSLGNAHYGLYVAGDGTRLPTSIANNTLNGNTIGPIGLAAPCSGVTVDANNIFDGPLHVEGGTINANVSWDNNRVYFLRGNITVAAGRTLTVTAGRVVKFAQNTGLHVNGILLARGTAAAPIYFTDYRDDAAGGDTNGDGSTTVPAAGWWIGIEIRNNGAATLDHTVIRYGGAVIWWDAPFYTGRHVGNLYKTGAGTLTLTNSVLSNSASHALRLWDTGAVHTVSGNTFEHNASHGILLEYAGSNVTISGNTMRNNAHSGIHLRDSNPAVTKNTISNNPIGVYCENNANPVIGGAAGQGNDITGNANFGVQNISSSVTVNAKYNFWGAASGPRHATNPLGTGDRVSDHVDFSSYLKVSAFISVPFIEVSPGGHNFGDIFVDNTSSARSFTITNNGTANLIVGAIVITGLDAGQFGIQNDQASGQTLTPGHSASLEVVFSPTSAGAKSALLRIPSNDPANSQLDVPLSGTGVLSDAQAVGADKTALTFDDIKGANTAADSITSDLTLPGSGANGTTFAWLSSDTSVIGNDGKVTRPSHTQGDKQITLTATISKGTAGDTKAFALTVKALAQTDAEAVAAGKAALTFDIIKGANPAPDNITSDLTLPASGAGGTTVTWQSSDTSVIAIDGKVTRPSHTQGDKQLTLTATISKGTAGDTKAFTLTVKAQAPAPVPGGWDDVTPAVPPVVPLVVPPAAPAVTAPDVQRATGATFTEDFSAEEAEQGVTVDAGALEGMRDLGREVRINTPQAAVVLPPRLAQALLEQDAGSMIVISVTPGVGDLPPSPAHLRPAGADVEVSARVKRGDREVNLEGERHLILPYDPQRVQNPSRLGIYRWEKEKWRYVGGRADTATNTVRVRLTGFSRYAVFEEARAFSDLAGHWAINDIQILSARYIVGGLPGGSFAPDRTVTRAEFAAMVVNALEFAGHKAQDAAGKTFTDIPSGAWYAKAVSTAAAAGLVGGYADGTFGPERSVTREEAAVLTVRLLKRLGVEVPPAPESILESYRDAGAVGAWARATMAAAVQTGIIGGTPEGKLAPADRLTRAQAAVLLKRALAKADLL
ncbi:MAG: immunoglobulin-like domain-containing protein, partial [Bacillota bacterium]